MLIRVAEPRRPAFQLRKGEEGVSVFNTEAVDPPLNSAEVLDEFRTGSVAVIRSLEDVEGLGLQVVPVEGAASLPARLRHSHAEIRPGAGMTRSGFKQSLKELEDAPEEP